MRTIKQCSLWFCLISSVSSMWAQTCPSTQHPTFSVAVAPELAAQKLSGRLVVMMSSGSVSAEKLEPSFGPDAHSVWIAAKEVHGHTPQGLLELDPDELAYPAPFCTAPAGNYKIKVVLDTDHNIAYTNDASDGDLFGTVEQQNFDPVSDERISLTLNAPQCRPSPTVATQY